MAFKEPEFSKKGAEQFFEALAKANNGQMKKSAPKGQTTSTKKKPTPKKK